MSHCQCLAHVPHLLTSSQGSGILFFRAGLLDFVCNKPAPPWALADILLTHSSSAHTANFAIAALRPLHSGWSHAFYRPTNCLSRPHCLLPRSFSSYLPWSSILCCFLISSSSVFLFCILCFVATSIPQNQKKTFAQPSSHHFRGRYFETFHTTRVLGVKETRRIVSSCARRNLG